MARDGYAARVPSAALSQRRRAPESLLERNRARIVGAVVEVVAESGWSAMTFASVGRAAGLSARPVQDRFPDRWALAAAAWRQCAGPALESALGELLAAAGLMSSEPRHVASGSTETGLGLRSRLEQALASVGLMGMVTASETDTDDRTQPVGQLREALLAALDAAGRADYEVVRAEGPSADWLARAYEPFLRPSAELRAAAEILIVSEFNEGLSTVIGEHVGKVVASWCSPSSAGARDAARRAYLSSVALGLLLARTRRGVYDLDLRHEAHLQLTALAVDGAPAVLPDTRAGHLDRFLAFDTGDPALDALLKATMEEVGRVGYDGATTASIGRASGHSEGLIFARYPSKVELFLDATVRQHAQNWRANEAFTVAVTESHGPGIAEAVMIREMQRPHLRGYRAISLEQVRLALHNERLREVQWGELDALVDEAKGQDPDWAPAVSPAHLHLSVAVGLGVTLLPVLAPEAWQLPYDVVTVPLDEPESTVA